MRNHPDSTANPKQIIYVWNYLEWGGAQVYFFGLIKEAKKHSEIRLLVPKGTSRQILDFADNEGIPYEFLNLHIKANLEKSLRSKLTLHINKLRSELEIVRHLYKVGLKNTIVHIELAPWQSFIALFLLCLQTKVFVTFHNSLPTAPKWRNLLWHLKFKVITKSESFHIFTSNKNTKEGFRKFLPAGSFEKVEVTYTNVNPVEIDEALALEINRDGLLEKHNLPKNKVLIFCVGQFIDRKGRWVFLEAVQKVIAIDKDIAFVWISNSRHTAEDYEKIDNYQLSDNFHLIESEKVGAQHIELFRLLRLADVFTLPSFVEGLPIALLEAMALGIPSISTNINAIPEAVKHLETGILIEAGDSEALAQAVISLKNDKSLRKNLSKKGKEWVISNFDEREVAKIAIAAYKASFGLK